MAALANYTYTYPFASDLLKEKSGSDLRFATCDARKKHPYFFRGLLKEPMLTGQMLLVLGEIVRTHFFLHVPPMLDPVVTSNDSVIRFEGFSGCCGVYARVDLPEESYRADHHTRGTTNVDFNEGMRSALARMRDGDETRLSVGVDELALEQSGETTVEKKVKLPTRWVKGFSEAQSYAAAMELRCEVTGVEARKFIKSLPKGKGSKRPSFVMQQGKGIRLSQRETKGSVRISGLERVRVVSSCAAMITNLRIFDHVASGTSSWEFSFKSGRLTLLISPELHRGFSGEGQLLESLADENWHDALTAVKVQLSWQSHLEAGALVDMTGFTLNEVQSALTVLSVSGLTGFDLASNSYFHRVLPFAVDGLERTQPRLIAARKLVADDLVRRSDDTEGRKNFSVKGIEVTHVVRFGESEAKCTCKWFAKNQGQRGPCKHILAARIFDEGER